MAIGQQSRNPTQAARDPSMSLTGPTTKDQAAWNQMQATSAQCAQNCSAANLSLWRCLAP
eukprot:2962361-Amphidinium_carterae.1